VNDAPGGALHDPPLTELAAVLPRTVQAFGGCGQQPLLAADLCLPFMAAGRAFEPILLLQVLER